MKCIAAMSRHVSATPLNTAQNPCCQNARNQGIAKRSSLQLKVLPHRPPKAGTHGERFWPGIVASGVRYYNTKCCRLHYRDCKHVRTAPSLKNLTPFCDCFTD